MVEQRSPKPLVACSNRVSPANPYKPCFCKAFLFGNRRDSESRLPCTARELGLPVAEILEEHFYCDDSRPLACLALKLTFHSRFIVAFIGSFAILLRATLARAFRSAAHFRNDNWIKKIMLRIVFYLHNSTV